MIYIYLWRDPETEGLFVQCENRQMKLNETPTVVAFFDEVYDRADRNVRMSMHKVPYDSGTWSKFLDYGVEVVDV